MPPASPLPAPGWRRSEPSGRGRCIIGTRRGICRGQPLSSLVCGRTLSYKARALHRQCNRDEPSVCSARHTADTESTYKREIVETLRRILRFNALVTASCPDAGSSTRDDVRESSASVLCHALCHRPVRSRHLFRRCSQQPSGRRRLRRHRRASLTALPSTVRIRLSAPSTASALSMPDCQASVSTLTRLGITSASGTGVWPCTTTFG